MTDITTITNKFQEIDSREFQEKMKLPGYVVLDVRTPDEWHIGYIFGSRKIDIYHPSFESEIEKFDKKKEYLVYCLKGQRSAEACEIMAQHGFTKLYNLEGGLLKWNGPLSR